MWSMDCQSIKYPIYIISKGRWKNPLTAKFLLKENIPFSIVIEPQEYDQYLTTIPKQFIKILPFSNLGLGSFPARNWCWDDSIQNGFEKHFLFDDNIRGFTLFKKGERSTCSISMPAFICLQNLTHQYKNIGISGFQYNYFITKATNKPFFINTHVYSGMLINNQMPFRWRLKYNEDIDLCLQALHSKRYCTLLLNKYTINKTTTNAKMPGGNQTELYQNNNPAKKILKAMSIQRVWPQYVRVGFRYGRPHHLISWKKHFKHS